jgi:hypothetical protein
MKKQLFFVVFLAVIILQISLLAQYAPRQDVVWARTVPAGTITLDGNLDEAAWSQAETIPLVYGVPGPLPTSGWREEFQPESITDPTNATVKYLVSSDNKLWLGFDIPDSSIGGSQDWARWDGILMSVKDKLNLDPTTRQAAAAEYFYTWWYVNVPSYVVPGVPPRFIGKFGNFNDTTRTPEQIAAWDARTTVYGTSCDAGRDQKWVVEMKIDLAAVGYDATQTSGDVIAMNYSIWDCDYLFEGDPTKINTTRTWFQSPWGNANLFNVIRVYARPDVGLTSTLPVVQPDAIIPNGSNYPEPTIDGNPNEAVWQGSYSFELGWDIETFRTNYPGVGKFMSGHFQPELGGNPRPPVLDPSTSIIRMFFRDDNLYVAADINDARVQGFEEYDKIDGLRVIIGDRAVLTGENSMLFRMLRANFNLLGVAAPYEYLTTMIDSGWAQFAMALKGATTVNNNTDIDEGYTLEMKINLTKLGYPAGLGDQLFFAGVMLADGDSFEDPLANYGTRAWWFREADNGPAAIWGVLDPNTLVGVEDENYVIIPNSIQLYGNYPNPFNPSTKIKYSIPAAGDVNILIYNLLGENVDNILIQNSSSGVFDYDFDGSGLTSGVYFYKISLTNSSGLQQLSSSVGKMMLLK